MAEPSEQMEINVPFFYASSITIQVMSNDWTFFLGKVVPLPGDKQPELRPTCILQVSPQTAKDLHLLMKLHLEEYEERYGTIETDFSRLLEKEEA